jgi:hypothetical protein
VSGLERRPEDRERGPMSRVTLVLVALLCLACASPGSASPEAAAVPSEPPSARSAGEAPAHQVVVYYFYGRRRCPTCRKLEAFTREAVEKGFPEAVEKGLLVFRAVQTDLSANQHYVDDYSLVSHAVVVVDLHDGKQVASQSLEKAWTLVLNRPAYFGYVREAVTAYLRGD